MGYDVWRVLLGEGLLANALNFSEPEAGSAFLKKEKKSSFKRKKAQKNPRSSASLRGPCGAIFKAQKSASVTFVPRENARREWPSKEGCLDRLRRCEPQTQANAHDDSPTPCGIPFTCTKCFVTTHEQSTLFLCMHGLLRWCCARCAQIRA
jgi:hypothetical protein